MADPVSSIEVFADVACPFTHVGLRRFVERRTSLGREDVRLRVRAWPLEVVNGTPMDAAFIAEEVVEIREQAAADLFAGFTAEAFPSSSLPALALTNAAYRSSTALGEQVALEVRDELFERGRDIAAPAVLDEIAARHGLTVSDEDHAAVLADHAEGGERGVVGSPYFIVGSESFFCPALDVSRDESGHLRVSADPAAFEAFLDTCFA